MDKDSRRSFLKKITLSGMGLFVNSTNIFDNPINDTRTTENKSGTQCDPSRDFMGEYNSGLLNKVAYPIGGLGTGMFCIDGNGSFSHMSVRNHPEIYNEPQMFGAISIGGKQARILEGPVPNWKKFGPLGSGNGSVGALYGLPHFSRANFKFQFPFCDLELTDDEIPIMVNIKGWSPFIATDPDNSSLPVGGIEYSFKNVSNDPIDLVFSFNSQNFMAYGDDINPLMLAGNKETHISKIKNGFIMSQDPKENKEYTEGHFAIFTEDPSNVVDYCWFRGGWFDPISILWETIKDGKVRSTPPADFGAPGASIYFPFQLKPGEIKTIPILVSWYVPNSDLRFGKTDNKGCKEGGNCCFTSELNIDRKLKESDSRYYKPWYSSKFDNIYEVSSFWLKNYNDLKKKSEIFRDTFYDNTLPPEVNEAVSANLTIIKSPTVLRQYDGRLWAFEGCSDAAGCCVGSCTHVWNYAQAIPHLFPSLERTLRQTEFCEDQDDRGHQMFRAALPIRPLEHDFYAASDGQLGGIMKVYREWRIYGNNEWINKMYPLLKKSINYCIETWDPKQTGTLIEPHHNTYDIEFWGADGMCTSFYLGALQAFIKIGKFLKKDMSYYEAILKRGKKAMEEDLFNGEYFIQKIEYKDLDIDPIKEAEESIYSNYSPEALQLLKKEGPKYQYGNGCLSDGVLGAWISLMCGLDSPIDLSKVKSHLKSVFKYNLKRNLSEHANPQRPAYALGNEGGLLLCTWPHGGKLSLSFVYSDEVWTGIEYQVASHLISVGLVEQGLDIVRTCRRRYDGRVRNPFNEYECGHWYARAMSSYGLIQALTGVKYDAVDEILYVDSKIGNFKSFLSTNTGFGTVELKDNEVILNVKYGTISPKKCLLSDKICRIKVI